MADSRDAKHGNKGVGRNRRSAVSPLVMGIFAHVDGGKTTLSENILFTCNAIRRLGRVDHKDTFLDTNEVERSRGITVFSKTARFALGDRDVILIDTPGHSDFGANMERTLQVMDFAVLVIGGADGVQSHTATLWRLFREYGLPVFIFVNKMDMPGADKALIFDALRRGLAASDVGGLGGFDGFGGFCDAWGAGGAGRFGGSGSAEAVSGAEKSGADGSTYEANLCDELSSHSMPEQRSEVGLIVDFQRSGRGFEAAETDEDVAMCSEALLGQLLKCGKMDRTEISRAIKERKCFPVFWGSALKSEGVEELLAAIERYVTWDDYGSEAAGELDEGGLATSRAEKSAKSVSRECQPDEHVKGVNSMTTVPFGARVYAISRDKMGGRLTHLRVTSGTLSSKMILEGEDRHGGSVWREKADQLRLYSGDNFEMVRTVGAGQLCAVTGLTKTFAGQGLGTEAAKGIVTPLIEPTLQYKINILDGTDHVTALRLLRMAEEEEPTLRVWWDEENRELSGSVMGRLEVDVMTGVLKERFGMEVAFEDAAVLYKETPKEAVIGIGHYEPLRHYSEVQLMLEPLPRGSGVVLENACMPDELDTNWQRLIMTHLEEKVHRGTLIGAPLTDVRITILAGKGHLKHTEGGDFRQATYRAVRNGLRRGGCVLLEPWCTFRLEVPTENVGRALADMQKLGAKAQPSAQISVKTFVGEQNPEGTQSFAAIPTEFTVIEGSGPQVALGDYQKEVASYTKGAGRFFTAPAGYMECHNEDEIVAEKAYIPEADLANPTGSVFCSGGTAVYVDWDEVETAAHVDPTPALKRIFGQALWEQEANEVSMPGAEGADGADGVAQSSSGTTAAGRSSKKGGGQSASAGTKELEQIFLRTYGKSKRQEALRREMESRRTHGGGRGGAGSGGGAGNKGQHEEKLVLKWSSKDGIARGKSGGKPTIFIVDGYNLIHAWPELKGIFEVSVDGAVNALAERLANYKGFTGVDVLLVFDGYGRQGSKGTKDMFNDVEVIYTREGQTADRYIEEATFGLRKKRDVVVVTSDRAVQMAALGDGALRMSSREFVAELERSLDEIRSKIKDRK